MNDPRELRDALRLLLVAHGALDDRQRPCGTPLSVPHAHALLTLLQANEPVAIASLASTVAIDRTNVSRLCARMEALGEVQRSPNPLDGRSTLVQLTERGRALALQVDRASAAHFARVVDALGPGTTDVLGALHALTAALGTLGSTVVPPDESH